LSSACRRVRTHGEDEATTGQEATGGTRGPTRRDRRRREQQERAARCSSAWPTTSPAGRISLSYDSIFEVVSEDHQKFQIATSGTVDMQRPNKIHTTRRSGFSDTEMVFDGTTLSFLGKGQNAYIQTRPPGRSTS
jgi:hypothetical protein